MSTSTKNPVHSGKVNRDDYEDYNDFLDAWTALGAAETHQHLRDLYARGIIDAKGNLIPTHTPPDMLDPNSSVEQ